MGFVWQQQLLASLDSKYHLQRNTNAFTNSFDKFSFQYRLRYKTEFQGLCAHKRYSLSRFAWVLVYPLSPFFTSIIKCFCAFPPVVPKHRVQVTRSSWFFNSISPKRNEGREQVKEKRYTNLNVTTSKAASGKFQNLKDKCSWKLFNEWGTSCSRPKSEARTLMYHTKKVAEVFGAPITVHSAKS